ncbi:MAG: hypothetical protein B7Z38_00850 [Rhodobacterales bacterium 12-64-8]|nr:MAG: hypothetical protein B7Z38_00850 [Rhodobacterales bacterium 12-64-8]OYX50752.1 MAG: hypothetical protein B7Y90_02820 [Alphaproteobacteria bacterium 32-64-14]
MQMKPALKRLLLTTAIAATIAPAAAAQGDNPFLRGRYTDVTTRSQPEFDQQPVRAGAFDIMSSVGVAAELNDNVRATPTNQAEDTILRFTPRADIRSNWTVHEVQAGFSLNHREYLELDSETTTDYNLYATGRLDMSRDVQFRGGASTAHVTEERYAAASFGTPEPASYDTSGVFAEVQYRSDRIQLQGTIGAAEDQYDQAAQQLIRNNSSTYVNARLSYAVSPDVAVFVQGRQAEFDYDQAGRDGTQTTIDAGVNFELAAPFRGEIAVGNFKDDRDAALYGSVEGLNVRGNVKWFPTELTTVTFLANRGVIDPGLAISATSVNTAFGIRVDHELMRNVLLFGNLRQETNEYQGALIDREDDALSLSVGGAYKINRNMRLEFQYSARSQDSSGATAGPDIDVNVISAGIRFFP